MDKESVSKLKRNIRKTSDKGLTSDSNDGQYLDNDAENINKQKADSGRKRKRRRRNNKKQKIYNICCSVIIV